MDKKLPVDFRREELSEFLHQSVDLLLAGHEDQDAAVRQRAMDLANFPERLADVFRLSDGRATVVVRLKRSFEG